VISLPSLPFQANSTPVSLSLISSACSTLRA
jgi:hypothetical protein